MLTARAIWPLSNADWAEVDVLRRHGCGGLAHAQVILAAPWFTARRYDEPAWPWMGDFPPLYLLGRA